MQQPMADQAGPSDRTAAAWRELAELLLAGHAPLAFVAGNLLLVLQPLTAVLGVAVPKSRILQLMGLPPTARNPEQTRPDDA